MSDQPHFEERAPELDSLRAALEASVERERDLGASLIEAHDRLLRAEDELMEVGRELAARSRDEDALRAEVASVRGELVRREQQLREETVQRERLQAIPAVRLLHGLPNLPGMGWLKRRRAKAYEQARASAQGPSGGGRP